MKAILLTKVSDRSLLIVMTSSTFRKMMMIAFIITRGEIM